MSGADKAIRVSTAAAVVGVAGIAAYVSYWHAYEVVRAHGEAGITARLEPATIDGLVYSSSMVVLYAARHRLRVPSLARWLLALGIVATLAANVAHGWAHGPVGAAVAAWPAASLVGSYELLLWLIRTAGDTDLQPAAHQAEQTAGQAAGMQPAVVVRSGHQRAGRPADGAEWSADPGQVPGPARTGVPDAADLDHDGPPVRTSLVRTYQNPDHGFSDWSMPQESHVALAASETDIEIAAVTAYMTSLTHGTPLSERRLAAMFGKTSRRWARKRMAEGRLLAMQPPGAAVALNDAAHQRIPACASPVG